MSYNTQMVVGWNGEGHFLQVSSGLGIWGPQAWAGRWYFQAHIGQTLAFPYSYLGMNFWPQMESAEAAVVNGLWFNSSLCPSMLPSLPTGVDLNSTSNKL